MPAADIADETRSEKGPPKGKSTQFLKTRRNSQKSLIHNLTIAIQKPEENFNHRTGPGSGSFDKSRFSVSGCKEKRGCEDLRLRSPSTTTCRSTFHRSNSSASDVDSVMLQSQVTTLQWQLRQAEASRQMYRAVMEQVVSFLQRTQTDLNLLQDRIDENDGDTVIGVPRSRSAHAVDTSPTRFSAQRSETNFSFQKAKSFAQIGDPDCPKHGNAYREMSWRRPQKQKKRSGEINLSKLSEEAFRLLRTVKSLLSTREPDLTSRLNPPAIACLSPPANATEFSSSGSTVSVTLDSDVADRFQQRQNLVGRGPKDPSLSPEDSSRRPSGEEVELKGSPPQLSLSSADDESGFSSLNSFQEIGLPIANSTFCYSKTPSGREPKIKQEAAGHPDLEHGLCLPESDNSDWRVRRRWSSNPIDGHVTKLRPTSLCTNGEAAIRVLWV